MNKIILKITQAVLIVGCVVSTSQAEWIRNISFKIGQASVGQVWRYNPPFNYTVETNTSWGSAVGVGLEFIVNSDFGITLEVNHIEKNMRGQFIRYEPLYDDFRYKNTLININCLSVPVLATVNCDIGPINGYLEAGPRWDFLYNPNRGTLYDVIQVQNFSRFGATIGAGIRTIRLSVIRIGAEIRYAYDLQDYSSDATGTITNRPRVEALFTISIL